MAGDWGIGYGSSSNGCGLFLLFFALAKGHPLINSSRPKESESVQGPRTFLMAAFIAK